MFMFAGVCVCVCVCTPLLCDNGHRVARAHTSARGFETKGKHKTISCLQNAKK